MTFPKQLKRCFSQAISGLVSLFLLLFFLSISNDILAQNNRIQDVLLLENGDKIKGRIIQQTEEIIQIRLYGGSEITYKLQEIKEITQEKFTKPVFFKVKEKGYFNRSTIGLQLIDLSNNNIFSLRSINGYHFNSYFAIGLGAGIDNYSNNNYSFNLIFHPNFCTTFLSISGDMTKTKITPIYSIEHGYGFLFIKNEETQKGGLYFNYGIGFKLRSKNAFDWIFSINYQSQTSNSGNGNSNRNNSGIMIRTGFSF